MHLTPAQWRVLLAVLTIQVEDGPADDGLLYAAPTKERLTPPLTKRQWIYEYTQKNLDAILVEIKRSMT